MEEKWKKIRTKSKKLMYEGFTRDGKPSGAGTSYYENGNKYQEGVFDDKGLIQGREYYDTGILRFEGTYKHNDTTGPNYPAFGFCYDEDGNEFYYGEVSIYIGHVEHPVVRIPDCYGPIIPRGVPDFSECKWTSENRRLRGVYFARSRGKKARTKFVEFLDRNGFTCKEDEITSRESTISSKFPIRVDLDKKQYSHLNTVTSAAAVANSRLMYPVDRFYMLLECAYSFVVV